MSVPEVLRVRIELAFPGSSLEPHPDGGWRVTFPEPVDLGGLAIEKINAWVDDRGGVGYQLVVPEDVARIVPRAMLRAALDALIARMSAAAPGFW